MKLLFYLSIGLFLAVSLHATPCFKREKSCKDLSLVEFEDDQPKWFQLYIKAQRGNGVKERKELRPLINHFNFPREEFSVHVEQAYAFIGTQDRDIAGRIDLVKALYLENQPTLLKGLEKGDNSQGYRRCLGRRVLGGKLEPGLYTRELIVECAPPMLHLLSACDEIMGEKEEDHSPNVAAFLYSLFGFLSIQ